MGGCPSADTVRSHRDDSIGSSARASAGGSRALVTDGGSRPRTPIRHSIDRGDERAPSTPNIGYSRPRGLSIVAPETPSDTRPRGSTHPDIVAIDPDAVANTQKYLELELARISIPQTPTASEADLYRYNCPICMCYFREIWKVDCCSNYVCLICALGHIKNRTSDPAVHTWYTIPTQQPIEGVGCPVCGSDRPRFSRVTAADKTRSYQESPHTRDALKSIEARRKMEVGPTVATMQFSSRVPRTDRDRESHSRSESRSMLRIRNHPITAEFRQTSEGDALASMSARQPHVSIQGDVEVEHDEDDAPVAAMATTSDAPVNPHAASVPASSSFAASASSSNAAGFSSSAASSSSTLAVEEEVVLGYSPPPSAIKPTPHTHKLQAHTQATSPSTTQPSTSASASGSTMPASSIPATLSIAPSWSPDPTTPKRPDSAPPARVTSAAPSASPRMVDGADAIGSSDPLSPPLVPRSSTPSAETLRRPPANSQFAPPTATRRSSQGWAEERKDEAKEETFHAIAQTESTPSSPPPRLRTDSDDREKKESDGPLFMPSPHAFANVATNYRTPHESDSLPLTPIAATSTPSHATVIEFGSTPADSTGATTSVTAASAAASAPIVVSLLPILSDQLLEESFSYDSSASFAMHPAAIHPMPMPMPMPVSVPVPTLTPVTTEPTEPQPATT